MGSGDAARPGGGGSVLTEADAGGAGGANGRLVAMGGAAGGGGGGGATVARAASPVPADDPAGAVARPLVLFGSSAACFCSAWIFCSTSARFEALGALRR